MTCSERFYRALHCPVSLPPSLSHHHPVSGQGPGWMADNQAFIHFTKVTEHLPNAGNHSRHRGFSSELLLLMSSVCTGAQGPLELVKWNENSHLIIESSDAKSQEKLWFHLLHHFTSDKTQGQTTCPKVFVGSEQDFNTSYKGLRHTCHPHAHMPPTPAQPPVLVAVGMTDSPLRSFLWCVSGHPTTAMTLSLSSLQGLIAPWSVITTEDAYQPVS